MRRFAALAEPSEVVRAGGVPIVSGEPTSWNDVAWISGEIPRVTDFEHGMPSQVHLTSERWAPDPLLHDERWMAARVRGRGVVPLAVGKRYRIRRSPS